MDFLVIEDQDMWVSHAETGSTFSFRRWTVGLPFWFLAFASAAFATLPWFPFSHRFSLHTLFLATTLFAVVLGLVCYTVR
ncbi:MAG: hypothetical protein WD971_08675 [Pirellulales bacterium]